MANPLQSKIAEKIADFIRDDAWRVVKYKILVEYADANQHRVNANVRAKDPEKAAYFLGLMDGAKETIEITERLSGELNKGQLAVDVALRVIENKQREKEYNAKTRIRP